MYITRTARCIIATLELIEIFSFTRIIMPAVILGIRGAARMALYLIGIYLYRFRDFFFEICYFTLFEISFWDVIFWDMFSLFFELVVAPVFEISLLRYIYTSVEIYCVRGFIFHLSHSLLYLYVYNYFIYGTVPVRYRYRIVQNCTVPYCTVVKLISYHEAP